MCPCQPAEPENRLHPPLIIAHRGQAGIQENTLEAFEWAIQIGADMVEFDVRRTKDGVLVIHHDADIDGQPICDWTYEHLYRRKTVPTLQQTLTRLRGRILLDIELKETGYEAEFIDAVLHVCKPEQLIVTSFHRDSLKAIRLYSPSLALGLLLEPPSKTGRRFNVADPFGQQQDPTSSDWDVVLPHWKRLNEAILTRGEIDQPMIPWTVNLTEQIRQMVLHPFVLGVITDVPTQALATRAQMHPDPVGEWGERSPQGDYKLRSVLPSRRCEL